MKRLFTTRSQIICKLWQLWTLMVMFSCCDAHRRRLRVHAGSGDIHDEFPFVVGLNTYRGARLCTGSLIASDWIITAGHCVTWGPFFIRYSNFTAKTGKVIVAQVLKVILHPSHFDVDDQGVLYNDMALVKTTKIPTKTIGRLSAIDYKALIGLPVKYAGFGSTVLLDWDDTIEEDAYRSLQVGEAVVIYNGYDFQGPKIQIAPNCSQQDQGIRAGDSGGPLIYDGKIVGVAMSAYSDRNIANYAAVCTSLQWIQDTMKIHGYIL